MISEETFIRMCKTNGLHPYKKEENEVIQSIALSSLDDFFEVCSHYEAKCVFYSIVEERDLYDLDKEEIIESLSEFAYSEMVKNRYKTSGFKNFEAEIGELIKECFFEIDQIINKQSVLMENIEWGNTYFLQAFIPYQGMCIGIQIVNDEITPRPSLFLHDQLIEKLQCEFVEKINNCHVRKKTGFEKKGTKIPFQREDDEIFFDVDDNF